MSLEKSCSKNQKMGIDIAGNNGFRVVIDRVDKTRVCRTGDNNAYIRKPIKMMLLLSIPAN